MRSEIITYKPTAAANTPSHPPPANGKDRVSQLHAQLVEFIAESDDSLLEKFFAQGGLSEEEMRAGVHTAIQKQSFIPLFCTAAETNVGTARLLDFVAKYGSSRSTARKSPGSTPDDNPVDVLLTDPEPVLYVFKTMSEAQFGELSFFRLYSGSIHVGQDLYNSDRNITERFGQIYILNGKNRTSVESLNAGDIGATVKLKDTHTGNTLCTPRSGSPFPKSSTPNPISTPPSNSNPRAKKTKSPAGLAALHEEDQTFLYKVDGELHQTVISGQGELHLQVIAARLRSRLQGRFRPHRTQGPLPRSHQRPRRIQIPPQEANRRRRPVRRSLDAHRTLGTR
jgi:elongation factor G